MPITVLLVDDQELMRMGLRMIVDAHEDVSVVGEAADGLAAVRAAGELNPDVVLMDIRMPIMDGVAATEKITQECPQTKVLVMTTFDLDEHVLGALNAGASGFLLKDTPPEELVSAIRAVAGGDAVVSPKITRRLLDRMLSPSTPEPNLPESLQQLTDREREVLDLIASGLSNGEIGAALHLTEATVKTHVGRVLAKLGLRDRVQAVVFAYEHGLVKPGS
ncbi:response regulator transcription factor [Hoyosella rhizosphaerae]|uniref:DNA-binding response regulator n=1 Tax=Hoyosella rhizosphaerae TaxID=1755582 RepID=A0A916U371_9ACTN|nr:response regulator transcription factor [Hoyosella rhizosphaerae]MBN4926725.1 response regulator transcription factor [Hoyosella rhizosphaerae]GGC56925.1 DNA-binding response regulator [Hoyosella rhizosphaerae]